MPRVFLWLLCAALILPVRASAGTKVVRDIAYADPGGERHQLDVYSPSNGDNHAIVLWIHGGAWRFGDKAHVQSKPRAFNDRGYVFVSVNYRFHPSVTYADQATDIARAIRWVHDHAEIHGGDPTRIFLMGHSAGAHLAALVATDNRYLEQAGLQLSNLSGIILLDGAGYDIPRQVRETAVPRVKALYTTVFTEHAAKQKEASPIHHVTKGKAIPPFLIFHVAHLRDARSQSGALAAKLRDAGVEAKLYPAEGKTHASINREVGQPDDPPTEAVFQFLGARCQTPSPRSDASATP
jgi:acetyl esterase/lipase